jgi:hypothetical protein
MRVKSAALLVFMVCLLPIAAQADIFRISPQLVPYGAVEENVTIFGSELSGTESTLVVWDGPDGHYEFAPINALSNEEDPEAPPRYPSDVLVAFIPGGIPYAPGTYEIRVVAKDFDAPARTFGPAFLIVGPAPIDFPPIMSYTETVSAEATSAKGANVSYNVSAQNPNGDPVLVSCLPLSGSLFPIGTTPVECSATNSFGTSIVVITVIVVDSGVPVVTVPADIETTDAVVTFEVSAVDNIDGDLPVSCSPPSGSTFAPGVTQVVCTAVDSSSNVGVGVFYVIRAGGLPVVTVPADITVSSPDGEPVTVNYTVIATPDATIECLPSGNVFPVGTTIVTCTATNFTGSDAKTFTITVADLSAPPPVLTVPADIIAEATSSSGAVVTFTATATNGGVVLCTPPSGSTFALGETTVNCTATNAVGSDAGSFKVTVRDTTAPTLTLPADITAEATGPNGAVVAFAAWGTDAVNGLIAATCTPASGSVFALGTTAVSCMVSDLSGNTASGAFNVTVRDTTPPVLALPANITAEGTSASGAAVTYTASASDIVDSSVGVQCTPASGSTFALGTTTVSCSATDDSGNSAGGSFNVTVVDSTPPQILSVDATPGVLWPPNHQMVNVTVTVVAVDLVDPTPVSRIISVTSNQPVNGTGDGDTAPDWVITGPLTVQLRSERSHGQDRTYTITIETVDDAGNTSTATDTVVVSNSKRRAVH